MTECSNPEFLQSCFTFPLTAFITWLLNNEEKSGITPGNRSVGERAPGTGRPGQCSPHGFAFGERAQNQINKLHQAITILQTLRDDELKEAIKRILRDVCLFAEHASGTKLRSYQVEVARAIARSVLEGLGETFVVIFPRQSGKNELQAQVEAYLLVLLSKRPAEMVKISPTWKPQSLNAMRRLEGVLKANMFANGWLKN